MKPSLASRLFWTVADWPLALAAYAYAQLVRSARGSYSVGPGRASSVPQVVVESAGQ